MTNDASPDFDDIRPEYDFSQGVQVKHHEAYRRGTNAVLLDPDVARVFRDSNAVNHALRLLLTLAREQAQNGGSV